MIKTKPYTLLLLSVMICLLHACSSPSPSQQTAESHPALTQTPALKAITEKLAKSPENARLYYERGVLLQQLKQDSLALMDFGNAVKYDSTKAEYYSAVGDLLFEHKDLDGSLKWIKKAIELNPDDMKAHLKIAKMFVYLEDYPNAFREINKVLRENAMTPEAYFLKGMIYKNIADSSNKALSSFLTAVQIMPDYHDALLQIGMIYDKRNDSAALLYYQNAFHADTTDVSPLYAKGMYYQTRNLIEEAKQVYQQCIVHQPDYADAYFNWGYLLLQQDSFSKAVLQFGNVIKIAPDNAKAYYNRGLCKELMNNNIEAIADYTSALNINKDYKEAKEGLKRLGK